MLVVDTCVLIDITEDDPEFGEASAEAWRRGWTRA
jgi:hypothetical protein